MNIYLYSNSEKKKKNLLKFRPGVLFHQECLDQETVALTAGPPDSIKLREIKRTVEFEFLITF